MFSHCPPNFHAAVLSRYDYSASMEEEAENSPPSLNEGRRSRSDSQLSNLDAAAANEIARKEAMKVTLSPSSTILYMNEIPAPGSREAHALQTADLVWPFVLGAYCTSSS